MTDGATSSPEPDPAVTAPRDEELAELIKEADEDEDGQGASGMSDRLRDRTEQSESVPESPADLVD
ncbi:hypothetical protein N1028_02200 [Herbiconiux sp. CPCC 203407]|uniref:Uncharacterized protein n=1 Tax=Herbiconiux oxytropis TaxID=2970915 RepID=A0AA42BT06_9MICO|nr:hypothetical protein [Herbiconiux oxytropis]MCS5721049.1 hypothetical protein [Herbiconiux oxytropis]MCS5724701.1 hypothetical protein [Herbiconiux oxytropis]